MKAIQDASFPRHSRKRVDTLLEHLEPWQNCDSDFPGAPLSEVTTRVVRAMAMKYVRQGEIAWACTHLEFWRGVTALLERDRFTFLATFASGVALAASRGEHPRHYMADVIMRSREHQRNSIRGRPWTRSTV